MLIAIIGESCTGKSTLAQRLSGELAAEIYTGKDYLRLAKNPDQAVRQFQELMGGAVTGQNMIYVISEREHLRLLPEGAVRVLVTASLETILERFRARMRGNLPMPVEQMLRRNHGMFDDIAGAIPYEGDADRLLAQLKRISFQEIG